MKSAPAFIADGYGPRRRSVTAGAAVVIGANCAPSDGNRILRVADALSETVRYRRNPPYSLTYFVTPLTVASAV
jgi:hypothetical protein